MKVDISRKIVTVNNDKLQEEINRYEALTNQDAHLFMSKNTMDALALAILPFSFSTTDMYKESIMCKFKGRKVFQNDELEFGEVEIR